jgi:hypothetical protein
MLSPALWMVAYALPMLVSAESGAVASSRTLQRPVLAIRSALPSHLPGLEPCARHACQLSGPEPLRPTSPQAAGRYWRELMQSSVPDGPLWTAALWLAENHLRVDVSPSRLFVAVRIGTP